MNSAPRYLTQIINPVIPKKIGAGDRSLGGSAIGTILTAIIGGMFIIAFITSLIYLLTGGFHWITSGGDKANLEHARNKIIHAIVGLIVVASVFAVVNLLGNFLGVDFFNMPIPTIPNQ